MKILSGHRRTFLKNTLGAVGGMMVGTRSHSALANQGRENLPIERPSGFYRVVQIGRKWVVVDPQGHPVFLRGFNHYGNGDYMPLNLKERYGSQKRWLQSVRDRHRQWGFNHMSPSIGPSEPTDKIVKPERNLQGQMHWATDILRTPALNAEDFASLNYPFVGYLDVPRQYMAGRELPDVFSEEFVELVDRRCRDFCAPLKDNPNLIGYQFVQGLPWHPTDPSFNFWLVDTVRDGLPAHHEWVHLMKCLYGSVERWRGTYGIPIQSFDEILKLPFPLRGYVNEAEAQRDRLAFMQRICERWYRVFAESIRRYDTNHLLLGDRLIINRSPIPAYAIQTMKRYIDVLSVEVMGPSSTFYETLEPVIENWSGPVFLADTGAGIYNGEYPKSAYMSRDLAEYDALYKSYMTAGLEHPQLIGFGWCGYYETPSSRSGVVDSRTDEPLSDRVAIMNKWNNWMKTQFAKHIATLQLTN